MNDNVDVITREIYVHSTTNPPLPDRSVDAEITVSNSKHMILTNWARTSQQTQYTLKILDPKIIGLVNFEQNNIEKFFDDLLLSCNLILKCGAFLIHRADMNPTKVERKKNEPEPPTIEQTENGTKLTFHETVLITDSYHLTMGFKEDIDENKILEILSHIMKLDSLKSSQFLKIQDLKKALEEYKIAVSNFNRIGIFKHLFNSIELATNCDGKDRSGTALDSQVSSLSGISINTAKDWREFYSRTKHIDKDSSDEAKYIKGINDLPSQIRPLRETSQKTILVPLLSIK